jgi:hypothetical protein
MCDVYTCVVCVLLCVCVRTCVRVCVLACVYVRVRYRLIKKIQCKAKIRQVFLPCPDKITRCSLNKLYAAHTHTHKHAHTHTHTHTHYDPSCTHMLVVEAVDMCLRYFKRSLEFCRRHPLTRACSLTLKKHSPTVHVPFDTGPAVSGLIGAKLPKYSLFGDVM